MSKRPTIVNFILGLTKRPKMMVVLTIAAVFIAGHSPRLTAAFSGGRGVSIAVVRTTAATTTERCRLRVFGGALCMSSSSSSSGGAGSGHVDASAASVASAVDVAVDAGISRLDTLRVLLSKHGAPGSRGCSGRNDLVPVRCDGDGDNDDDDDDDHDHDAACERLNLHPHLYPIARSSASGNYVCALRRAYAEDADYEGSTGQPWPIVESQVGGPGMRLLALNSEHMMRRIAAEADDSGDVSGDLVAIYNDGLGKGELKDAALDTPYEIGSVKKLGYGLEKYALLRIGPFPDLYESMAKQHAANGDEQSSLIAAEAANGKFPGFGSTFAFYASLLSSFPNRDEEAKDAARMCLRLPIPSVGMDMADLAAVARLAKLAALDDGDDAAVEKMKGMYERIREHEKEDEQTRASMTPEQVAIEKANYLLDTTALTGGSWRDIRFELGDIYQGGGRDDMAQYVNPSRSYTME